MPLFSQPQETARPKNAPSYEEIRQRTQAQFGFILCLWQIKLVEALFLDTPLVLQGWHSDSDITS